MSAPDSPASASSRPASPEPTTSEPAASGSALPEAASAPSFACFDPSRVVVLDGGLGTHLEARGADVTGALWSAQILRDAPDEVRAAHRDFFEAGAQLVTTCSYQVSADGLLAAGLLSSRAEAERECERLLWLSVDVAAQAARDLAGAPRVDPAGRAYAAGAGVYAAGADVTGPGAGTGLAGPTVDGHLAGPAAKAGRACSNEQHAVGQSDDASTSQDSRTNQGPQLDQDLYSSQDPRPGAGGSAWLPAVAASIGPYGAGPGQGTEYDGAYGLTAQQLAAWHRPRIEVLAASGADVLLAETVPSILEVHALAGELSLTGRPWMLSVTAADGRLGDGTALSEVVRAIDGADGLVALGVNCCAPAEALAAVRSLADAGAATALMAYPNSGETWDRQARAWKPAPAGTPESIVGLLPEFLDAGVRLIGGCCRVGPEEIAEIARAVHG